jgi:leader peptidase (prepilin peptidase) / N-methyltransferase
LTDLFLPSWFWPAVVAAYGLVIGSFLNVVIYRVPREISLLRPRSHCPSCGALVHWYDNVPVISWLLLLGKCRTCRAPISVRYPAVELLTGALSTAVLLRFGYTRQAVVAGILVLLLIPLSLIDLELHLLPEVLTYPGIASGIVGSWLGGLVSLKEALIGALLGAALPYLVRRLWFVLRKVEGMGLGDVSLLAMIGAFLGWKGMLLTLGLGSTLGALLGIALMAIGRGRFGTELPFGTFLAVAAIVALFFGPQLVVALGWVAQ